MKKRLFLLRLALAMPLLILFFLTGEERLGRPIGQRHLLDRWFV